VYDAPWRAVRGSTDPNTDIEGTCSGDWVSGEITDNVIIPADLPTGDYVVGFRWDCEETAQIWSTTPRQKYPDLTRID
jgi:hypothetical protein